MLCNKVKGENGSGAATHFIINNICYDGNTCYNEQNDL